MLRAAKARREAENESIARYSLNRGRIFHLEFKPLDAFPYYAEAYGLRPSDPDYVLPYAGLLLSKGDHRRGEPVYAGAIPPVQGRSGKAIARHLREPAVTPATKLSQLLRGVCH